MLRDVLSWLCAKPETVKIDSYPTTSLCSLESLPEELYHYVLSRIFVHSAPSDRLSLLLVCKTWNAIGHGVPFSLKPNKFLPLALRRGFPRVDFLDLSAAREVQDERLPCLVGLENLVALKLRRCREITDNGLAHLHPLTQLKDLNLARCPLISDAGFVLICKNLSCLHRLNIKYCYGLTGNGLMELTSLKSLLVFNCSGCQGLRYEAMNIIGRVSSLKVLKMNDCPAMIWSGIDPLFGLTALTALLLKTEEPLKSDVCDVLLEGATRCFEKLQRLDLTIDANVGGIAFEALASLSKLEFLRIGGHGLIEKEIFSTAAHLPNLRKLQLSDKGNASATLSPLSELQSLKSLAIKRKDINDEAAVVVLTGFRDLPRLTELVLWNITSLTGDSLKELTSLQELCLQDCPLLESSNMECFKNLRCLRILKFGKCSLLDDAILDYLKWIPRLEQLYISSCPQFTGSHFGLLSELTELSTVVLQFSRGVNDNALKQLTNISSLRRLEVVMCGITEDGLRVLLNGDLRNLEYLNISGCHAPKLTTQALQNKLPKFKKLFTGSVNLSMLK